jgi:hypothetical protein
MNTTPIKASGCEQSVRLATASRAVTAEAPQWRQAGGAGSAVRRQLPLLTVNRRPVWTPVDAAVNL